MDPDRWREIERLCLQALERNDADRTAFLDAECAGDADLRREVESLIAQRPAAGSFLATHPPRSGSPATDPRRLAAGERLGPYEITALVGAGGMGEVYKALDTRLNRTVAIKVLPPAVAANPERRARFEREAKTLAGLAHPHICPLFDVGEHGGSLFLVMEYVAGRTLADRLREGSLPLHEALKVATEIAEALAAAHHQGVIHRDLKPGNVMLTKTGAKLLDFGLAKMSRGDAAVTMSPTERWDPGTTPGTVLGTVPYIAPEQLEGRASDTRSDIFAFGAVLYEMLAGTRAFPGESDASIISAIMTSQPPPVSSLQPLTPPAVDRLVQRCLEKDPDARWQSAADVAGELRWMSTSPGATGANETRTGSRRPVGRHNWLWITMVAVLTAVAAVGLLAWRYARPGDANRGRRQPSSAARASGRLAPPPPAVFAAQHVTRLTDSGLASRAALSPDGRYAVHVKLEANLPALWVRQTATTSDVRIVPPSGVQYDGLAFSPDGNYVYYAAHPRNSNEGALYRVAMLGGTPGRVLEGTNANTAPEFSGDGRRMMFVGYVGLGATRLVIANLDGTALRVIAPPTPDLEFAGTPAWSPDGRTILVVVIARATSRTALCVVDEATGVAVVLSDRWPAAGAMKWMPDGRSLVMQIGTDLWQVAYPSGERRRITNDLNGYSGVSMSKDGSLLATVQSTTHASVWVAPSGGRLEQPVAMDLGREVGSDGLSWTPEGRLVFTARDELWSAAADGTEVRQLTSDGGKCSDASVSPDGRTIYYTKTTRDGGETVQQAIWRMGSDGSDQQPLTRGTRAFRPIPSPDGRWVYFSSFHEGTFVQPMRVPAAGGEPSPVSQTTFALRQLSPDGTDMIGLTYNGARQQAECVLLRADGSSPRRLGGFADVETSDFGCRFHSGAALVSYVAQRDGVSNIYARPIAGGGERQITHFRRDGNPLIFKAAWSRDGRLAVSRGNRSSDVVLISTR